MKIKKVIVLFIIPIISLSVITPSLMYYQDNNKKDGEDIIIEVKQGEYLNSIINKLHEKDIVKYPLIMKIYNKIKNNNDIKYGHHTLNKGMSYDEIFKTLSQSNNDKSYTKITIPEGYNVKQIADILEKNNIVNKEEFLNSAKLGNYNYWFLKELPIIEDENYFKLEGFLYPDTYYIPKNTSVDEIIGIMLDNFEKKVEVYKSEYEKQPLLFFDKIKLASIIEREASSGEERKIVSGVFYNRLNSGMKLESCATVEYILNTNKRVLSNSDIQIDSPFNTYKYQGLTPSSISNPSLESIDAAINPQETGYFFFVGIKGTKIHAFATTYKEHLDNIKKFRD